MHSVDMSGHVKTNEHIFEQLQNAFDGDWGGEHGPGGDGVEH